MPQDGILLETTKKSNHPSVLDLWCLLFKLLRGLRFHKVYLDIRGYLHPKTIGMKLSHCHLINKRSLDFSKKQMNASNSNLSNSLVIFEVHSVMSHQHTSESTLDSKAACFESLASRVVRRVRCTCETASGSPQILDA